MPDRWRGNRQTVSWLSDLYKRGLLDLEPSYQRRSVWNPRYRQDFIETIILGYPSPSIFLHEEIDPDGNQKYAVVDGKQRLTSIFEFVSSELLTRDGPDVKLPAHLREKYFKDLSPDLRRNFYAYEVTIEYVPTTDELLINEVFDRINRNTVKLTRQELRHARYSGVFATAMEELAQETFSLLPQGFPRIVDASRRQMKDVEFITQLVLLTERGPSSTSQDDLDQVYADRDEDWEGREEVLATFRQVAVYLKDSTTRVERLAGTRLRNQVDFYSLFGALLNLLRDNALPDPAQAGQRLVQFADALGDDERGAVDSGAEPRMTTDLDRYYAAARSAANDPSQRSTRIRILQQAISASES